MNAILPPVSGTAAPIPVCESDMPVATALAAGGPVALAIIIGTEGPSYRPPGAAMVIDASGQSWGNLSSGCIDKDVILHAVAALETGRGSYLRYGRGSPFLDLRLPCGGGLDIQIVLPQEPALREVADRLVARETALLSLSPEGEVAAGAVPGWLTLSIRPQIRFLVFGKGTEARVFARLTTQAGYPTELFSADEDTIDGVPGARLLPTPSWPGDLAVDRRTAITLFFHDHDHETDLLVAALDQPAFYIGAQGSRRAHDTRLAALADRGVAEDLVARIATPFGLIPSARDPRTLAISVLADIVQRTHEP